MEIAFLRLCGVFLITAALCLMPAMPLHSGESLARLEQAARKWDVVKPENIPAASGWLVGEWKCIDRAIRGPRNTVGYAYAYLDSMSLAKADIFQIKGQAGRLRINAVCDFLGEPGQALEKGSMIAIELDQRGFLFQMTNPDVLLLRTPGGESPDEILLQHAINGDVLLFKRILKDGK